MASPPSDASPSSRMSNSYSDYDPYATDNSQDSWTDRSRSRSRALVKLKQALAHVSRTLYVTFVDKHQPPRAKARIPHGALRNVLNGFLERNLEGASFQLDKVSWSAGGNLTLVLSVPPPEQVMNLMHDHISSPFKIKHESIGTRLFEYRTCVVIPRVPVRRR